MDHTRDGNLSVGERPGDRSKARARLLTSTAVVLNRGSHAPSRDIWPCLKAFFGFCKGVLLAGQRCCYPGEEFPSPQGQQHPSGESLPESVPGSMLGPSRASSHPAAGQPLTLTCPWTHTLIRALFGGGQGPGFSWAPKAPTSVSTHLIFRREAQRPNCLNSHPNSTDACHLFSLCLSFRIWKMGTPTS